MVYFVLFCEDHREMFTRKGQRRGGSLITKSQRRENDASKEKRLLLSRTIEEILNSPARYVVLGRTISY